MIQSKNGLSFFLSGVFIITATIGFAQKSREKIPLPDPAQFRWQQHEQFSQQTAEFLKKHVPQIPLKREMKGNEAPLSNAKIREVLGFREEHDWRKYV